MEFLISFVVGFYIAGIPINAYFFQRRIANISFVLRRDVDPSRMRKATILVGCLSTFGLPFQNRIINWLVDGDKDWL